MTSPTPTQVLAEAIATLDRVALVLLARMADMTDAENGHPRSGALDSVGGRSKTTFCELHGKERCECGAGTPFSNLSDPTGEAAIAPDRAKHDRRELERAIRSIGNQAALLANLVARYTPHPASDEDRRQTLADNERSALCSSCARYEVAKGVPKGEPAFSRQALSPGADPVWLCQWCWRWVRDTGSLPPVAQVEQHHKGVRVRRSA